MSEFEGFILVGGASSRMGTDKAQLELGGQTFVERIHRALGSITTATRLVGEIRGESARDLLPAIPDVHEKWGALGGLHTSLKACSAEWAVVVACDLPFVTGELFVRLASLRQNFEAVVPVQPDGRFQPLCALYRASVCQEAAGNLIASGERRPRALLSLIRTRLVEFKEVMDLQGSDRFFSNLNTREDYENARKETEM